MFVCIHASLFLTAGDWPDIYMSSSISRTIIRLRWLRQSDASYLHLKKIEASWCALHSAQATVQAALTAPAPNHKHAQPTTLLSLPTRTTDAATSTTAQQTPHTPHTPHTRNLRRVEGGIGWEEEEEEETSVIRDMRRTDSKGCCPGGTQVKDMACRALAAWLQCIGNHSLTDFSTRSFFSMF